MLMRNLVVILAALIFIAACSTALPMAGLVGSGRSTTQTYDFSDFDSIELSDGIEADITAASSYGVEVTVDDNLLDRLEVEQRGKTVKIGLKPFTAVRNLHLHARITLPVLVSLDASGGSRAAVSDFDSTQPMRVTASGASEVRGDMVTGDLNVNLSGASELELDGRGGDLRVTASGASNADLHNYAVADADVEASGASRVELNATGMLNARASGASDVRYTGSPQLGRIDESGAGNVSSR